MTENQTSSLAPLRVLVVENDPKWRQDHLNNLTVWGYEVHVAEPAEGASDLFQSLWQDAIAKAKRHRCHIALVDMRLREDDDPTDISGLRLVPELAPTVSIIVSGYGDRKTVREALKSSLKVPERAHDFVGKEDGPEVLLRTIREAEQTIWCRRPVNIVCPDELGSAALVKRFFPEDDAVPPDEVDDVLRCLFPNARRLKIETAGISQGISGLLLRRRSAVIKVFEDQRTLPVIVKLARSGRIKNEIDRFRFVEGYFAAARYADPQGDPIELWDLGGIVYRLVDSDQQYPTVTFSVYYRDAKHRPSHIRKALSNFERLWHSLYQTRQAQPDSSQPVRRTMFAACLDVWGNEWCDDLLQYKEHPLLEQYPAPFSSLALPNPIQWLIAKVRLGESRRYDDSGLPDTDITLTHGDLHGDNLFVSTRHDVWMIDYERTGFGPRHQDFVELENDILTHLAEMDTGDWPEYFRLLCYTLEPKSVRLPKKPSIRLAKFEKERAVIGKLRELAVGKASGVDGRSYYWGLFLNATFRLTLLLKQLGEWDQIAKHLKTDQAQRSFQSLLFDIKRCLVVAGMACHRLDHWDSTWPLSAWPGELHGSGHTNPVSSGAPTFDYDVFISYSSKDKDWVQNELLPRLEARNFRVCIDFRDFRIGAASVTEMERAILTSHKTIAVLSPNYLTSDWAKFEHLMVATLDPANQRLRFVPLLKAKCDLPLRIGYLTYVDMTESANLALSWDRLFKALALP